jgi:hypothetical protein
LAALAAERVFPGRNVSKADVRLYRISGRAIALKDYGSRPFLVRHTIGRWFIRREALAYRRAGSLPGLAPFLGRVGSFALATGWLDAVPLAELSPRSATPATFDGLDGVIASLHARGVAVSDLHHRDVLVSRDGTVHVVDFAAAYVLPANPSAFSRRVFHRLCAQDRLAAARMRARFTGNSEAEALAELDPAAVRLWGAGRRLKALWDRIRGRHP